MKKEKSGKIKRSRALKNNLYACSLLKKICPSLVVHQGVSRFLGYFEWLFYSAFFMRYVINSLRRYFISHTDCQLHVTLTVSYF